MQVMEKVSIRVTNLFFLVFILAYVGMSFLTANLLRGIDLPMWQLLVISDSILVFPVIVFLLVMKANPLRMECMKLPHFWDILRSVFYAYALLPLMALINAVSMNFVENPADEMLGAVSSYSLPAKLLMMAVMPAVVEEFIFRGVFTQAYRRRNVLIAALMSGILFGIIHLNISQCAYALMIGVAFTLLNEASGSIVTSMVAHFAINANSVFLTHIMGSAVTNEETDILMSQGTQTSSGYAGYFFLYIVLGVFAIAGVVIAILLLRGIARGNGRAGHMASVLKQGFLPNRENTERFLDIPLLAGIAVGISIMVVGIG